jgi:hypothetical protein
MTAGGGVPDRNPYLILGIDFGAPADVARRRFAQAARRLRRSTEGPYTVEDLTWALHEVEALDTDPADNVTVFRVPANPAVFEPAAEGLFKPPADPLPRRSQYDAAEVAQLRSQVAVDIRRTIITALSVQTDLITAYSFEKDQS